MPYDFGDDSDQAYVRMECEGAETLWKIYDSTGEQVGHASSREVALAVALQNDLIPVNVH